MLDAAMVAKNEIIDNDIVVVMLWMEVTEAKQEVEWLEMEQIKL